MVTSASIVTRVGQGIEPEVVWRGLIAVPSTELPTARKKMECISVITVLIVIAFTKLLLESVTETVLCGTICAP